MIHEIKRKNTVIATVRPEGELTAGIMGEEVVTMQFSLAKSVAFHIGDSVQLYGNTYYLATEPNCEKMSSREFAYQLEFQGIKYELAKAQYFFPDQSNTLTRPQFHIVGDARMMIDLIIRNANRLFTGWTLGTIDDTEAKQLDFDSDNCLSALAKIAEAFALEYWVDGDKSVHLTKRQGVSGYSFEYGKAKGLRSLLREPMQGSNVVTRLYALGSDKNIPGDYRNASANLRMAVPYLEKNIDTYGVIEHTQVFEDIYPRRIGTVTAVDTSNPLKFTDSDMDFDLNARNDNGTTILINGVSAKVNFLTGQLAGYQFEIKDKGFNSSTKTYTLVKNKNEKHLDVPSEVLRPAVGDTYVLTDIIMPQTYIANAEAELQAEAQRYLDENSRQRVQYALTTDPLYFREQNVNIALGLTVRVKDTDFNLDDELRVIRLSKSLSNPYEVRFEVAERAEIAKIVRDYIQSERRQTALVRTDRYNAELAKRSYNFTREVHDNVFDGEGYFDTEKIKPLSIDTKMLTVGSRLQQFSLPNVVLTVENNNAVRNTAGQLIHLTLEDTPRTWQITANVQTNITNGYHYIYIKAQRIGTNASVFVSQERINVEQDPVYYHFEAGSLGSIDDGFRRIKTTHGFTQVSPGEITTGRIASPSGSDYIEFSQDRINFVGRVTFQADSPAIAQTQEMIDSVAVGERNHVLKSRITNNTIYNTSGGVRTMVSDEVYGEVARFDRPNGGGDFQFQFNVANRVYLNGKDLIYMVVAKPLSDASTFNFGLWNKSFNALKQSSSIKNLGNGWNCYWTKVKMDDVGQSGHIGINSVKGSWLFYAVGIFESTNLVNWSPAPEDVEQSVINVAQAKADLAEITAKAYADSKVTAEEQRAIADAQAKLAQAEAKARELDATIKVGGRNLLQKSGITVTKSNYLIQRYICTDEIKIGETITLSVKADLAHGCSLSLFNIDGSGSKGFIPIGLGENFKTVVWNNNSNAPIAKGGYLSLYTIGNNSGTKTNTVNWIKLERGNKPTDWSPAPEDVDAQITSVESALTQQIATARVEAQNAQTTANNLAKKTDFLEETSIIDNVIATGTMQVGNSQGANAGVTGVGASGTDVRFYAGKDFENRNTAPFRVLDNGNLYAENAIIKGRVEASSGVFKGSLSTPFETIPGEFTFGLFYQNIDSLGWNLTTPPKGSVTIDLPTSSDYNGMIVKLFGEPNRYGSIILNSSSDVIYLGDGNRQTSYTVSRGKYVEIINVRGTWLLIVEKQF